MDYKDKINESLAILNDLDELFLDNILNNLLWPVSIGLALILISIILFKVVPKNMWKSDNVRSEVSGTIGVIGFCIFFFVTLVMMFTNGGNILNQKTDAVNAIKEASKEAIYQNFKISEKDMVDSKLDFDRETNLVKEIGFEYTDTESMTRYDLIFLFNNKTHEPSLLKTSTVDDNLIDKLSNK